MNQPRTCGRIAGVLLLALALAPSPAAAQSDSDRPSLRLGPVEFRPRLVFRDVGIDNNVFNEHTNPKRDFTLTASPDLEISTHPGRLRLAYTSAADFVYFRKYTSERSRNDWRFILIRPDSSSEIVSKSSMRNWSRSEFR